MFLKALFGRAAKRNENADQITPFQARKNLKLETLRNWAEITAMTGADFPSALKAPRFDMSETQRGIELAIELPGVAGQDIDIEIDGATLTLKAASARSESDQKPGTQRLASFSKSYQHRIQLPFAGDGTSAEATVSEGGQIKIFVPRASGAKSGPSKIEVRPA